MWDVVRRAQQIADEVLFPASLEVDQTGVIPAGHFDLLAREGFYGLGSSASGLAAYDVTVAARVVAAIASGCLATAFVWLQHLGAVSQRSATSERLLPRLCRGELRAGVAQGALRPGPPSVTATSTSDGGYVLEGESPWVTGWGLVDLVRVAARTEDDQLIWAMVEARESETIRIEPLNLVAVQASSTVHMRLAGHRVLPGDVLSVAPFVGGDSASGLRMNGSLAIGIVDRCLRLMTSRAPETAASLRKELVEVTHSMDLAVGADDVVSVTQGRAFIADLALRAASALVVAEGSESVLLERHPQRLLREATFLLVFGTRPGIRADLLPRLTR